MTKTNQVTLEIDSWIVGFTDGEGCFSVSIFRNNTSKFKWQIFPEFVITQGSKSRNALEVIKQRFQCGEIYINNRSDNHKEHLCKYCVRSISDLFNIIIPFFETCRLLTEKNNDFIIFKKIIMLLYNKKVNTIDDY